MTIPNYQLHPWGRILVFIIGVAATILCKNIFQMLLFEILLLPVIYISGSLRLLGTLILIVSIPMTLLFGLEYLFSGEPSQSEFLGNLRTVTRLTVCTSLLQILLIIPLKYIPETFKSWGFKNQFLLTATGSYFVWADIIARSERILLARLGSGYIHKRTLFSKARQIPFIILPLIIGITRTATIRAQSWEQKGIVKRMSLIEFKKIPVSVIYNVCVIAVCLIWLVFNVIPLI